MPLSDARRRLVRRLHRRKAREREGLVLVEGVRAVTEALQCGAAIRFVLRSPRVDPLWTTALDDALRSAGVTAETISDAEMMALAGTETPQGVLAVFEEPAVSVAAIWGGDTPRVLVLDGIQDPGNAGTLVRVAAAFRCTGVVALEGTTDLWGTRAVRASVGTTFRLPVVHCPWSVVASELLVRSVSLLVADAGGSPVGAEALGTGWALAVGGEGSGCREAVRARADAVVSVPMPGGVESLNVGVAGAILLYELTREKGA
jgi:TrmH family RNA methyltransferase